MELECEHAPLISEVGGAAVARGWQAADRDGRADGKITRPAAAGPLAGRPSFSAFFQVGTNALGFGKVLTTRLAFIA